VGLVVRCPIGCSTKVTVPAWRLDRRRSISMGFNERAVVMKLLGTNQVSGARSRPSMKKEKGRAEKKPISRADPTESDLCRRIPQNPLGANPKGLIQALAHLLLEAAGVESTQMAGWAS
jgi:hypothetical protein